MVSFYLFIYLTYNFHKAIQKYWYHEQNKQTKMYKGLLVSYRVKKRNETYHIQKSK